MYQGLKEEEKVFKKIQEFVDSDTSLIKSNSMEENLFDFKLIKENKEFLFEIYSPEQDYKIFCNDYRHKNYGIFGKTSLKYSIITKYYKQFKENPSKYLIINVNNDGNIGDINLNYRKNKTSRIETIFSQLISDNEVIGLFHTNKLRIKSENSPFELQEISVDFLSKMRGVITFFNGKFIELIINPYSNISKEEIKLIKEVFKTTKLINNPKLKNFDEDIIVTISDSYQYIFDNIIYKVVKNPK